MTKGEQIIGSFNASGEAAVDKIKAKAIELIDLIEVEGKDPRRKSMAISEIEKGTMLAVKSLF